MGRGNQVLATGAAQRATGGLATRIERRTCPVADPRIAPHAERPFLTGVWRYPVLEAGLALTIGPVVAVAVSGPTSRLVQGAAGDPFCYLAGCLSAGDRGLLAGTWPGVLRYLTWSPVGGGDPGHHVGSVPWPERFARRDQPGRTRRTGRGMALYAPPATPKRRCDRATHPRRRQRSRAVNPVPAGAMVWTAAPLALFASRAMTPPKTVPSSCTRPGCTGSENATRPSSASISRMPAYRSTGAAGISPLSCATRISRPLSRWSRVAPTGATCGTGSPNMAPVPGGRIWGGDPTAGRGAMAPGANRKYRDVLWASGRPPLTGHQPFGESVALVRVNDLAAPGDLRPAGGRLAEHRYRKLGRGASASGGQRRHNRVQMRHVEQES